MLAPIVIVTASVGGALGASALSDFADRYSIPRFLAADDAGVESSRATPRRVWSVTASATLWHWSGASPGPDRTVFLNIEPQIYPLGGLRWYFNGEFDREDILGPLDTEFGLWHSTTRQLVVGDIVSACWLGRDGVERCPQIVIR